MFHEEFLLEAKDENPAGEYKSDELKLYYYLPHISDGYDDLMKIISHEWLHGLFDWATEGEEDDRYMITADKDHFIMKILNFN